MLCPMKCLINGVEVNKMIKFLLYLPIDLIHAIVMDDRYVETPRIVPLSINGVTSYFPCRKLTHSEFENGDVPRIYFTSEAPYWYP